MPPTSEPATVEIALNKSAADMAVVDNAAPIFGIALGVVVMIVLVLNALAY